MKTFFLFLYFILIVNISAVAQRLKIYSFEEIEALQLKEKKMVVVLVGTEWCRYCQMMKETTLKDEAVINLLNAKYYFVYLNAEQKESIIFNRQAFQFKPTGLNTGLNELAIALATDNAKIAFPTISIISPSNEIILPYQQFISQKDLLKVLNRL